MLLLRRQQHHPFFVSEVVNPTGSIFAHPPSTLLVQDYKDNSSDWGVHFTVQLTEERMREAEAVGLLKKFKLTTTVSTSNMHLFNHKGKITKYDTPEQSEAACPFF